MIRSLQKRRRSLSFFLLSVTLLQLTLPLSTYALTSGPSQPEVQSFQPSGATEMVDLFSGDFTYNIPLFELPGPNGGYPFNLSYQAGIGMDQEASWVGLGWSCQPGAMTRQVRGLPDEFKGDDIYTKASILPNVTVGMGLGTSVEVFGGAAELGMGFSIYQNNYKGIGYSIDGTTGFQQSTKGGMTSGLGISINLDTQEGVSINPSLSLSGKVGTIGGTAGYNSKQGLTSIGMSANLNALTRTFKVNGKKQTYHFGALSSHLSLAHPGYTPQISMPMNNLALSATFKAGGSWWAFTFQGYVTGFYNEQRLANDKKRVNTKGYGYLNYQYATTSDLIDFNREKDGPVIKETPNLAMPSQTYDIYSVTGQGIGMMYRPMRNDYGVLFDQDEVSNSNSIGVGVDIAPAMSHVGVNLQLNHAQSTSGRWTDNNQILGGASFNTKDPGHLYEPWYFKVHGEPSAENATTLQALGGDNPVRATLSPAHDNPTVGPMLESRDNPSIPLPPNHVEERKSRSQSVMAITNGELLDASNVEAVSLFKVKYINSAGAEVPFTRTDVKKRNHFAGYTAITTDGLRYVYGIPAYNTYQEEVMFSAKKDPNLTRIGVGNGDGEPNYDVYGTDRFFKKTEMPAYAHSYLLTSIVGPDYVDVTNDGVTSDDLGYWVKFTYKQTADVNAPYKWRDPYTQAHFNEGYRSDLRDDKGSYVYGEKEMWYLARAETKSHIAVFNISARSDARGANYKLQDTNSIMGQYSYQLDAIVLYTRAAGPTAPIKTTRFSYTNDLCPSVENGISGKLTLKKVWFEYGASTRGQFNPYTFNYNNELSAAAIAYNSNAYDRWGNYKPFPPGQPSVNKDFPYADQNPANKAAIDANAAAWSLHDITLPSGGKITVDYESDDYAYVQQKTAMQMMSIVNPYATLAGTPPASSFQLQNGNLKVRFKLEKPIPVAGTNAVTEVKKYLDPSGQLYFKFLMRLVKEPTSLEYISGYVDVADINVASPTSMGLEKLNASDTQYTYGFFTVIKESANGADYNPFSMRAWQHLRANQPNLTRLQSNPDEPWPNPTTSLDDRIGQIKVLGNIGVDIRDIFSGFYRNANDVYGWGKEVLADQSWIRLNSPDKIKYGGGLRVRQVTMTDQWAQDEEGIYGQVYDYTKVENGATISSGVASYEPIIGGDENALHYAKKFTQAVRLRSDNNMFFEYPINESYYPGPQVGYSQVTVMSLPSTALYNAFMISKTGAPWKTLLNATLSDGKSLLPTGTGVSYGTSGKIVHEFYTARDYPIITDETDKLNRQFKLAVPIPLVGSLSITKLSATQGYSIITNDMHGKMKKVSNYRQIKNGDFEPEAMSWVKHNYLSQSKILNSEKVSALLNTLADNGDGTLSVADPTYLGAKCSFRQEVEMFHDMRQLEDNAWGGGASFNLDVLYIPIVVGVVPVPVPTDWPSITKANTTLRTAVTNKAIFRSGILESTEAFDNGSYVKTSNIKWDKLTGGVVVSSVTNDFDQPVYSYSIPAYQQYQGMGAAYQNIGVTFTITSVQKDPIRNDMYRFYPQLPVNVLTPGDEILLYDYNSNFDTVLGSVVYAGNFDSDEMVYTEKPLTAVQYKCMIVRSGYRNQLNVMAGTTTALTDPSIKGTDVIYTKTISVPKAN
jgi:hypothetical protein